MRLFYQDGVQCMTVRRMDNLHLHLRGGYTTKDVPQDYIPYLGLLELVLPWTERLFKRGTCMPNTKPAILCADHALRYQETILKHRKTDFEPLMTIKITPQTTVQIIKEAIKAGIRLFKLYPDGVTTNSEGGVRDFWALLPVFRAIKDGNGVLLIHAESPDEDIDCIDAEEDCLRRTISRLILEVPGLTIVIEHLTTEFGVNFVLDAPSNVAATIAPQYLRYSMNDIRRGTFKVHRHSLPEAKRLKDKLALIRAATSGSRKFFYGDDSAPHPRSRKLTDECCAGVFNEPSGIFDVLEIFEQQGALERFEDFTSRFGAEHYGLPLNEGEITFERQPWTVPKVCPGDIVPYRAGEVLQWQLAEQNPI